MPEPTISLTESQLEFFRTEGYLAVDAMTTQEEVARLREIYDHLFATRAGREEGNEFDLAGPDEEGKPAALPQILNPAKYAPELNDTLLLANVQHVGRQLLGEEAIARFGHAIFKPARYGAETPWHQDASYWNPNIISYSISVWVPLQEATPENGCMEFVPRSHTIDVVRHRSINNDPRVHGLELHPDEFHHVKNVAVCPLPPGGATFHGGYMFHHTGPNRSDVPRRAIILGISKPGVPRKPERRFPWLEEKKTARTVRAEKAKLAAVKPPFVE